MEETEVAKSARTQNQRPQELYCFIQDWQEKREFNVDELKSELGAGYTIDLFADIMDLKFKVMKILQPRLYAYDINVTETDKFIQICSHNILRKSGVEQR
jgi:hypothetical protein